MTPARLIKAKLSWRIAFWVLVSILVIEVIIVFPSYRVRQDELLRQAETIGLNTILPIVRLAEATGNGSNLVEQSEQLARGTIIHGGAFYLPGGQPIGVFGEPPALSYADMNPDEPTKILSEDGTRYDIAWTNKGLQTRYHVVARLDTTYIQQELSAYAIRMISFILLISAFVTAAAMLAVGLTTINPILKLRENLLATGEQQEHMHALPIEQKDELGDVMRAFHTMTQKIADRTNQLQLSNAKLHMLNERLQHELTLAQRIQRSLLLPSSPEWQGPTVRCYTTPMSSVGGDFYVYHNGQSGCYGIAVGDVSGKGMPAALLMSISLAFFQSIIQHTIEPAKLLAELDTAIAFYTRTTRLNCALSYMLLTKGDSPESDNDTHTDTYHLCIANAGCVEPIIRRADGSVEWVNVGGMPLGIGLGAQTGYEEVRIHLAPGDVIVLTSDGVVEARNVDNELFGFERFEDALATSPSQDADGMLKHIKAKVYAFVGEADFQDDMTIVVVGG